MTHHVNDYRYSDGLQKLETLHHELKAADEEWLDAATTARKIKALITRLDEFWQDLPRNREPVLQAFERADLLMKFIIVACDNDKSLNQSFATRKLVQDTLDDFCIVIATYRDGFNDD